MTLVDTSTSLISSHEKCPRAGPWVNDIEPRPTPESDDPVREIVAPGLARQPKPARNFPKEVSGNKGIPYLHQGFVSVFCLNEAKDLGLPRI